MSRSNAPSDKHINMSRFVGRRSLNFHYPDYEHWRSEESTSINSYNFFVNKCEFDTQIYSYNIYGYTVGYND